MKNPSKLLIFTLITHLILLSVGITNYINDLHSFRQTQTALSTIYLDLNAISFDYETPVLGAPWKIPFEFPIYQYFVLALQKLTNLELGLCGRLISIICFYLSIWTLYLFKNIFDNFPSKLALALTLSCPIYIFWTRTFLIESMVLLFAIQFFYHSCMYFKTKKNYLLLLIICFGLVSALIKVTTFGVAFGGVILYILYITILSKSTRIDYTSILAWLIILAPCIICQYFWTKHTDSLKTQSFLGSMLTSNELFNWNFGTLKQRLEIISWLKVFRNSSLTIIYSVLIFFILIIKKPGEWRFRLQYFVLTAIGLSGPMVFYNLYVIHDYYHYANTIFLICALAIFFEKLYSFSFPRIYALILVLLLNYCYYFVQYFRVQITQKDELPIFANQIKTTTKQEDVLLVLGEDWSSEIPYFTHRKSICLPDKYRDNLVSDPIKLLSQIQTPNIRGVVISREYLNDLDKDYMKILINYLNLKEKYYSNDKNFIFIKN